MKEFTGKIIGIVRRMDDVEEKMGGGSQKLSFAREQI